MKRADLVVGQDYLHTGSNDYLTTPYGASISRIRVVATTGFEHVPTGMGWSHDRYKEVELPDGRTGYGPVRSYRGSKGILAIEVDRETGEPKADNGGRLTVMSPPTGRIRGEWDATWEAFRVSRQARDARERDEREQRRRRAREANEQAERARALGFDVPEGLPVRITTDVLRQMLDRIEAAS